MGGNIKSLISLLMAVISKWVNMLFHSVPLDFSGKSTRKAVFGDSCKFGSVVLIYFHSLASFL